MRRRRSLAGRETKVARLSRELSEAFEQQVATAEILNIISNSPSDTQPVFEAIVQSGLKLFPGALVSVALRLGDTINAAAVAAADPARVQAWRRIFSHAPLAQNYMHGAALLERRMVDLPDVADAPAEFAAGGQNFLTSGNRAITIMPMMRGNEAIGLLSVVRLVAGPLSDKQIALLKTFASQAVIAVENTRLLSELRESLQQQTATADVLKVISRSAFDLETVLDALLSSACRLCEADIGTIRYKEGGEFRLAATFGCKPEWIEHFWRYSTKPDRSSVFGRTIAEGHIVHIPDLLADPDYKRPEAQKLMGFKAALGVPLAREGEAFGVINLFRFNVSSFENRQIELVQTFADQAVIAIENVRLFEEVQVKTRDLTESLEYQTATGDVLNVISRSPSNISPVLDTIVGTASRLCDSYDTIIFLREGDILRVAAHRGPILLDFDKLPIGHGAVSGRAVIEKRSVHVHDVTTSKEFPDGQAMGSRLGYRTILATPLIKDNAAIGAIIVRRAEVRPFADKQVALLQTFADQAVIALQNVRLFDEVQAKTHDLTEALTYQTGSANILSVIASSPTNVQPVLQAIVESACELCGAYDALVRLRDGDGMAFGAHHGPLPVSLANVPFSANSTAGRAMIERKPVHVHDLLSPEGDEFPDAQELARAHGERTILSVPLVRENESIGAIILRRTEVHPFSEKQIRLLQTFAYQAVIAIENARLFNETQEALERQTATADILKVIAGSPDDVKPVFEAIAQRSKGLVDALSTTVFTLINGAMHLQAFTPTNREADVTLQAMFPAALSSFSWNEAIRKAQIFRIADTEREPSNMREIARLRGFRSMLLVPLVREQRPIGLISVTRVEPGPFSDHHVQLLQTFADQAVIAIQNVKLFEEAKARTRELSQSLEDLRTAQDRLVQTEKLASLGQLTAGIAHEIKNPLNFINNFSALSVELTDELNDVLKQEKLTAKGREETDELTGLLKDNLGKVVQHGKRADSIVKNMLLHSRQGSGEYRLADINALLNESLNLAYHGARAENGEFNITVQREFDAAAGTVELFPQEITRAFLNLISNGVYAASKRKTENRDPGFEPTIRVTTKNLGSAVEIGIRDNGTGIPPEVQEKIFNPFFTTKPAGEGTGLGLSMTHDIVVKQHGGRIDVATEPGKFTEFTIVLPRKSAVLARNGGET
jgi:GAF domain-containing protein